MLSLILYFHLRVNDTITAKLIRDSMGVALYSGWSVISRKQLKKYRNKVLLEIEELLLDKKILSIAI